MTLNEGSWPSPEPGASVLILTGRLDRGDVAALCERVRTLLVRSRAELVVCDVAGLVDPDCTAVDVLARIQLTAQRLGCRILVRGPCRELLELLSFAGLADVLPPVLRIEPVGQTEQREQALGVEEEADPGDPPV
jgi:ABC-type transporter Mla MlaB component